MADSRVVTSERIAAKLCDLRQMLADNRTILETLSTHSAEFSGSAEFLWVRATLDNRANQMKATIDGLLEVQRLYRSNRDTDAAKRARGLIGVLLIGGQPRGKIHTDATGESF